MLDRAVAAPVADGRQRVVRDRAGDAASARARPAGSVGIQSTAARRHRRSRAGRSPGRRSRSGCGRRSACRCPGRLPELVERRVEVEVDAHRDAADQLLVGQHARDVDQHVGARRPTRRSSSYGSPTVSRVPASSSAADSLEAEVARPRRGSTRRSPTLRAARRAEARSDRLDEQTSWPSRRSPAGTAARPRSRRPGAGRRRSCR